jgi:hypothetical protein
MNERWIGIDDAAKMLAAGMSRRRVLGLLARGAAGGALGLAGSPVAAAAKQDKDKDKDKGNGPSCRGEGHPCEGNQTCCEGLTCAASGPGAARRCTAGCEGDCPAEEPAVVVVDVDIDVEADCAYSGEMRRTTCTFTAAAGNGDVASVAVAETLLCAEVVGGDYDEVDLGANARPKGKAKGFKSKKTEDGTVVVTLELAGEVTIASTATYWCETEGAVLVPVTGPGLSCAEPAATPPAADTSDEAGAVVVQIYACDVGADDPEVDWFAVCGAPAAAVTFRLSRVEGENPVDVGTAATDAEGLCRFEALPPGTYRLETSDGAWCHAESDSVDERGDVVVAAGERATVWAFYCAQAK